MSRQKRGFAVMDPEKQREIASRGGKAAHKTGRCHRFAEGSLEASAAGKKGGAIVSADSKHMAEIGRRGGEARRKKKESTT